MTKPKTPKTIKVVVVRCMDTPRPKHQLWDDKKDFIYSECQACGEMVVHGRLSPSAHFQRFEIEGVKLRGEKDSDTFSRLEDELVSNFDKYEVNWKEKI